MWYLVGQILLWLFLATVLGFFVGWLIRGGVSRSRMRGTAREWEERLNGVSAALGAELEDKRAQILSLQDSLAKRNSRVTTMDQELETRTAALADLQDIFDSMQTRLSDLELQVRERDAGLQRLELEHRSVVTGKDDEIASLQETLAALGSSVGGGSDAPTLDGLRSEIEDLRRQAAESGELRGRLAERDRRLRELDAQRLEHEGRMREIDRLKAQLELRDEALRSLEDERLATLRAKDDEVAELRRRLEQLQPLEARLRERDAQIRLLEPLGGVIKDRDDHIRRMKEQHAAEIQQKDLELERLAARVIELEQLPLAPVVSPGVPENAGSEHRDDLKQIVGIGPVLEETLNGLGYRTFLDVALWGEEDVERISSKIGSFRNRIHKDQWVEQARELHARKYGEPVR